MVQVAFSVFEEGWPESLEALMATFFDEFIAAILISLPAGPGCRNHP